MHLFSKLSISKLSFSQVCLSPCLMHARVGDVKYCQCLIINRPVLPSCAVNGRFRHSLYYYYYYYYYYTNLKLEAFSSSVS